MPRGMQPASLYEHGANGAGGQFSLCPTPESRVSTCAPTSANLLSRFFTAYGISATVDDSVQSKLARFDIDDVGFDAAGTRACYGDPFVLRGDRCAPRIGGC